MKKITLTTSTKVCAVCDAEYEVSVSDKSIFCEECKRRLKSALYEKYALSEALLSQIASRVSETVAESPKSFNPSVMNDIVSGNGLRHL